MRTFRSTMLLAISLVCGCTGDIKDASKNIKDATDNLDQITAAATQLRDGLEETKRGAEAIRDGMIQASQSVAVAADNIDPLALKEMFREFVASKQEVEDVKALNRRLEAAIEAAKGPSDTKYTLDLSAVNNETKFELVLGETGESGNVVFDTYVGAPGWAEEGKYLDTAHYKYHLERAFSINAWTAGFGVKQCWVRVTAKRSPFQLTFSVKDKEGNIVRALSWSQEQVSAKTGVWIPMEFRIVPGASSE